MIKSSSASSSKKRKVQITSKVYVKVKATYNNTHLTCINEKGEVIYNITAGEKGFKGAKKSTPYAAMQAAKDLAAKAIGLGIKNIVVYIKGLGPGREFAVKGLYDGGLSISLIVDETPIVHNGCRAPKERRN